MSQIYSEISCSLGTYSAEECIVNTKDVFNAACIVQQKTTGSPPPIGHVVAHMRIVNFTIKPTYANTV